jgi:hypothetical protein
MNFSKLIKPDVKPLSLVNIYFEGNRGVDASIYGLLGRHSCYLEAVTLMWLSRTLTDREILKLGSHAHFSEVVKYIAIYYSSEVSRVLAVTHHNRKCVQKMCQAVLFLFPLTCDKPVLKFTYSMQKKWCELFLA